MATATATKSARKSAVAAPQAPKEHKPLPPTELPYIRGLVTHVKVFEGMISFQLRYANPTSKTGASTVSFKSFDPKAFADLALDDDVIVEYAPQTRQHSKTGEWETPNFVAAVHWM